MVLFILKLCHASFRSQCEHVSLAKCETTEYKVYIWACIYSSEQNNYKTWPAVIKFLRCSFLFYGLLMSKEWV